MTTTTKTASETVRDQLDYLDTLMWALISKLNSKTYPAPNAQYVDAIAVGRLASEIQTLQEALQVIHRHNKG